MRAIKINVSLIYFFPGFPPGPGPISLIPPKEIGERNTAREKAPEPGFAGSAVDFTAFSLDPHVHAYGFYAGRIQKIPQADVSAS